MYIFSDDSDRPTVRGCADRGRPAWRRGASALRLRRLPRHARRVLPAHAPRGRSRHRRTTATASGGRVSGRSSGATTARRWSATAGSPSRAASTSRTSGSPADDGGGDWHDAAIQVEGPAVAAIEAIFLRTWNRRAKKWARLDPARLPRPAAAGATPLAVISNSELRDRFAIRRAALHAIRESRAPRAPRQPLLRARSRRAARAATGGRARRRRAPAAAARERLHACSTWRRGRCSGRCWRRACASGRAARSSTRRCWPSTTRSSRSAATTSITGRSRTTSRWW